MNVERLVSMANDIARYFASEPDREEGIAGIASHIKRFWEPRMLQAITAHCRDADGAGLDELALAAVRRLGTGGL
ncbi:formate dehydrogenase delta subunit [Tahibacter aquaticus]|uniref:Formate dehydrogenase delta subunit n=1 Tax=Tahibacter aquaticus TaxID=520092 RepID=A0A4R6YWZ1_9GAMM|nr:formate dehydrogenase subunit delta [Tahibacter aquaticus]TDR43311.1 formate dehydrogenase delta subunit [Tahibacter aquaticus]